MEGRRKRTSKKLGYYGDLFSPADLDSLIEAVDNSTPEDEIALLKVLIKRAVADGASTREVTPAIEALVKALRLRHAIRGQAARNLDDALAKALTEIGAELGIGT